MVYLLSVDALVHLEELCNDYRERFGSLPKSELADNLRIYIDWLTKAANDHMMSEERTTIRAEDMEYAGNIISKQQVGK